MNKADIARWDAAQEQEFKYNTPQSYEHGLEHFRRGYAFYRAFLNIDWDLNGRSVIEIGCANYSAISYCANIGEGYVIEPLPSDHLRKNISDKNILLFTDRAEDFPFPDVDEVWLLNVLQHTISPDLIIEKAKAAAKVVRFFEPIEAGTDVMHLHNFTLEYFRGHFGDCVKYYPAFRDIEGFHSHQCAYGVWTNPNK